MLYIEVIESLSTPFAECHVRVGDNYLIFDLLENGQAWKIKPPYRLNSRAVRKYHVDYKDFLEAKRQAQCWFDSQAEVHRFPERSGTFVPDEDKVRLALNWGRFVKHQGYSHEVITDWLIYSARWTSENEKMLRSIHARNVSAKGQETKRKNKERARKVELASRQGELF